MRPATELSSTSPKVARAQAEDAFGKQLGDALAKVGANKTIVAHDLGIERSHLYDVINGHADFKAGWIKLLPPAVRRILLVAWADADGEQLEPRPIDGEGDDRRSLTGLVRELQDVILTDTAAQEDDHYDAQECERLVVQIDEAMRALAQKKARITDLLARRGGPVRRIHAPQTQTR